MCFPIEMPTSGPNDSLPFAVQASLADYTGFKSASSLRLGRKEEQSLNSRVAAQAYTVRLFYLAPICIGSAIPMLP